MMLWAGVSTNPVMTFLNKKKIITEQLIDRMTDLYGGDLDQRRYQ